MGIACKSTLILGWKIATCTKWNFVCKISCIKILLLILNLWIKSEIIANTLKTSVASNKKAKEMIMFLLSYLFLCFLSFRSSFLAYTMHWYCENIRDKGDLEHLQPLLITKSLEPSVASNKKWEGMAMFLPSYLLLSILSLPFSFLVCTMLWYHTNIEGRRR